MSYTHSVPGSNPGPRTPMFNSPLLEIFLKHQKFIYTFFVQAIIYVVVYSADYLAVKGYGYNKPMFSLLLFLIGYLLTGWIIRKFKKQNLFIGFPHYGFYYNGFLSLAIWAGYLFMVRIPKFG